MMSTTKIAMSHRDDPLERRLLQGKIVMRTTRKGPYPSQETKHRSIWARAVYGPEWEPCRVHSPPITEANINKKKEEASKITSSQKLGLKIARTVKRNFSKHVSTNLTRYSMFSQSHFFLNTDRREVQYLKYLKFFFDKPEGFVARSVYNQKTR